MRKDLTEVVFILDKSGSMSGLEADTIGGFNSLIEKQKKEEGEAFISVVLFNDDSHVIYDRVPIEKIEPMNDKQYFVGGCTALLDAIGGAIHHIGNVHKYAREEDRPEKTLFIITTDGMENSSHRYTYDKVKKLVEKQKETYGWSFYSSVLTSMRLMWQEDSESAQTERLITNATTSEPDTISRALTRWLQAPDVRRARAPWAKQWLSAARKLTLITRQDTINNIF